MTVLHPRGVNHLAITTCDMKAQLTFFSDVLGCPLKALYWMHGVADTFHGFVELAPDSYIAFVQGPNNAKEVRYGVTHAGNPTGVTTIGTMQHLALHVDDMQELLAMRDRIRSHGLQVLGPMDHGFIQSIYFAGPDDLVLEICCGTDIDEEAWVDPEVTELCGISPEEVERLKHPESFAAATSVEQPAFDGSRPHFLPKGFQKVMTMPDQAVWDTLSEATPPVRHD